MHSDIKMKSSKICLDNSIHVHRNERQKNHEGLQKRIPIKDYILQIPGITEKKKPESNKKAIIGKRTSSLSYLPKELLQSKNAIVFQERANNYIKKSCINPLFKTIDEPVPVSPKESFQELPKVNIMSSKWLGKVKEMLKMPPFRNKPNGLSMKGFLPAIRPIIVHRKSKSKILL